MVICLEAEDQGSIPESGRSPGEGNGNLLQYSCLENPMDWGAWQAIVRGVAKSQTRLSNLTFFLSIVPFGEGNGNPLQCPCLENPMDGGAWWAIVYGVAESDMTKQLTQCFVTCKCNVCS